MGWYLDGTATAVVGTHTHVQTADDQILPQGTAYITDVGMTGPHDGVIGVEREPVIKRFLNGLPARFESASGNPKLHAVVVDCRRDDGQGEEHHAPEPDESRDRIAQQMSLATSHAEPVRPPIRRGRSGARSGTCTAARKPAPPRPLSVKPPVARRLRAAARRPAQTPSDLGAPAAYRARTAAPRSVAAPSRALYRARLARLRRGRCSPSAS